MVIVVLPQEISELSRKRGNKNGLPKGYRAEMRDLSGKNIYLGENLVGSCKLRGEETVINIFEAARGAGEFMEALTLMHVGFQTQRVET